MALKSPYQPTFRRETDSFGAIEVPVDRYWGAQTQRSKENFPIGDQRLPIAVIHAFGWQKEAAAKTNIELSILDKKLGQAIIQAAGEVADGHWDNHFPLVVWQTGSGTQTNMNANEVIANRAIELLGGVIGSKHPVHPNDHCNLSQSSNDSFPTVMHISVVMQTKNKLWPAIDTLVDIYRQKIDQFADIVKIGRTHMQDATPLTLGQELSGHHAQIVAAKQRLEAGLAPLYAVAQGGTAVGTGVNSPQGFGRCFAKHLSNLTGHPFRQADNTFQALAAHDDLVAFSGDLSALATALMKIANDLRLLASGPRSGIGELTLPANEPGSSIMPGKVNPTQCEALTQVCAQVLGNHTAIAIAGSNGHLQLNVFKPMIIHNLLQSITLLADAIVSFANRCLRNMGANRDHIQMLMERSLMLVTALAPHIGYDQATQIASKAYKDNSSLRAAALALKLVSAKQYDQWVRPEAMTSPDPLLD